MAWRYTFSGWLRGRHGTIHRTGSRASGFVTSISLRSGKNHRPCSLVATATMRDGRPHLRVELHTFDWGGVPHSLELYDGPFDLGEVKNRGVLTIAPQSLIAELLKLDPRSL